MQQLTIIGNVGKDAVVRDTEGSKAINFSVAVNTSYVNKENVRVESTSWYDAVIWRKDGQSTKIADYLKAGQQVAIQGTPKAKGYKKDNGDIAATIEVRVTSIELLGKKATTEGKETAPAVGDDDNDLPF